MPIKVERMSTRTIIRHCFVISMDDDVGDIPDCDILIEDGLIAAISPRLLGCRCR
jgi:hypothetical protein